MKVGMEDIYRKDLEAFFGFYEQVNICPYYFCSKPEIIKFAKEYIREHYIANDLDFVYFFRQMLKILVGELDSHSCIRTRDEYKKLPLGINYDGARFTVDTMSERYEKYHGKTVNRINNVKVEQLAKEAEKAISYSTNGYRYLETSRMLSYYDPLRTLPSIESDTDCISYAFSDGEKLEVQIGETGFIKPEMPKNFEIETKDGCLWLRYRACREEYAGQALEVTREIEKIISGQEIESFALDLRNNMGGDDRVIWPLIDYLKTQPELEKRVYVNRAVQSAALFALNEMVKLGTQVLGTEIGSSMNHFGNNRRLELPSGRFLTITATRYFYLDENDNYVTVRTREEFGKLDKKYIRPKYIELERKLV